MKPTSVSTILLLVVGTTFPTQAFAVCESDSKTHVLLRQLDELQKRVDRIDREIDRLYHQKHDCDRDIEKLRYDIDHVC